MKLNEKILALRKQQGMSQEDLAEKLHVSRQAVSRWEVGSALPDANNILQLSKLFSVTADYLLNDDWEEKSKAQSDAEKAGENTMEKVREKPAKNLHTLVWGIVAGLGVLGHFLIYLVSRFVKVAAPLKYWNAESGMYFYRYDGVLRVNYSYFVDEYHLQVLLLLFTLLIVAGGVGIWLQISCAPWAVSWRKKHGR